MKITIVGTGYVGLVSGACFADGGLNVVCVDRDKQKIENLEKGIIPIYEPGLEELVIRNYKSGRLKFSTSLPEAIQNSQVVFIAVGTPPGEDGSANLDAVFEVAEEIAAHMNDYTVIATKSTVPVGTNLLIKEKIQNTLDKRNRKIDFSVASNPEFLKEGAAIEDFMKPDRVVIGTEDNRAKELMHNLYKPFQLSGERTIFMDIPSAEMTKYAANAMLATKISFINDIANLCELVGADVNMVRRGISSDSRIGNKFIYPGVGYGGACFPKDVKAIINTAKSLGYNLRVLQAVEDVNEEQKMVLYHKVSSYFEGNLEGKTIAVWGLSFKPNTDDMREAPSVVIINELLKKGVTINAYDPVAMDQAKQNYFNDKINYCSDAYEACLNADALMMLTEWSEFKLPSWDAIGKLMNNKVVFDGRNIYDSLFLKSKGFQHFGIGF